MTRLRLDLIGVKDIFRESTRGDLRSPFFLAVQPCFCGAGFLPGVRRRSIARSAFDFDF